jgi:hypothetical protein
MTMLLKKADLERELGLYLGWGPGKDGGAEAWDAEQTQLLKSFVDSGYSRFINTPPIPNGVHPGGHDWTFLRPVIQLQVPAGVTQTLLPDDFGGFTSPELTLVSDAQTSSSLTVKLGHELQLRIERQKYPSRTSRPLLAVVMPRKEQPQRFELQIYPIPDRSYTLQGSYNLVPEALSDSWPYAYGGITHRETLLESCLAVAEERWDRVTEGPHYLAFMRCLAASIRKDREMRPQWYGYDSDHSDRMHHHYWRDFPPIKVNGVVPL